MLTSAELVMVYVGDDQGTFDDVVRGLVANGYWQTLEQYGVGSGAVGGSFRVAASAFFRSGSVQEGLVSQQDVDASVMGLLHGAGGAAVPRGSAYVLFLPPDVNVTLGSRGDHVYETCTDVGGYHAYDGAEPYAVIGSCPGGPSADAVSHELAELATNPVPGQGWFSDDDLGAGGEVCDLCDREGPVDVGGQAVARLWSNADGECMPR